MPAKRVLFLGITGINKREGLKRLARRCEDRYGQSWHVVDFEKDYLWPGPESDSDRDTFIDNPLREQVKQWREAWNRLSNDLSTWEKEKKGVFLGLHGSFTRGYYGVRSMLDPGLVASTFKPDLIITLIADVYEMWWRTEGRMPKRSKGQGRHPTLEQLISARRFELILGDQIAYACAPPVKNLMLSVSHPCDTFAHAINHPTPCVVYLSFPISQPREMQAQGEDLGMQEVSEFVRLAYQRQDSDDELVVECPLGVDEIPFIRAIPGQNAEASSTSREGGESTVAFNRSQLRWNLDTFWPQSIRLCEHVTDTTKRFPVAQLKDASGSILTDVTYRDYRLVDQANRLLVFNPIYKNRNEMAGSVRLEIEHAISQRKMVYLYQNPEYDREDVVGRELGVRVSGHRATMAPTPSKSFIERVGSLDELLDAMSP